MSQSGSGFLDLPLLTTQLSVWMAHALASSPVDYNVGQLTTIEGPIDPVMFAEAARRVVQECEALRLRFDDRATDIRQIVGPPFRSPLTFVDLNAHGNAEATAQALIGKALSRPFDLREGPLFHWLLLRQSSERFLWCQIYHHIVIDGVGRALIVQRLAAVYNQLVSDGAMPTAEAYPLAQLVKEEELYAGSPEFAADRAYWLARCADLGQRVSLTQAPAAAPSRPLRDTITLDRDLVAALRLRARDRGSSLSRLITAVAAAYLCRFTNIDDILLGFQVACRGSAAARITPAMLTNTVPLRLQLGAELGFDAVLDRCGDEISAALEHQRFPWVTLRRTLGLSPAAPDPFCLVVNYVARDVGAAFSGSRIHTRNLARGPVRDLQLNVDNAPEPGGLIIDMDGNPGLYPKDTLAMHGARLKRVLEQIAVHGFRLGLSDLAVLDATEKQRVLHEFNGPLSPPPETTLCEMFDAQVSRTPDATALICGERRLSYAELDSASNRLARYLIGAGIGPGSIIGILLDRSSELITALLAVLKTGAAYLPFDPSTPLRRIADQLTDSRSKMLLASERMRPGFQELAGPVFLALDDHALCSEVAGLSDLPIRESEQLRPLRPEDLAYVIYTSGSTGHPKGVMISHRAIAAHIVAMLEVVPTDQRDTLMSVMTIAFDAANGDVFRALLSGATLALLDDEACRDPERAAAAAKSLHATVLDVTPSFWRLLPNDRLPPNLRIMVGGEIFPRDLVERARDSNVIINCYGPTEAAVATSAHRVEPARDANAVPIGRPLRGYQMYILDRAGGPQPIGAVGELCIGGACLADGYLGDKELTKTRFVPCPFGPPGSRMYRSGDLAYWREDGVAVVLGRADDQVKINGYRVEPTEIEHVLSSQPGIAQAAVVARQIGGRMRLIAYVVPEDPAAPLEASKLRPSLAARLPAPMVPSAFVSLETLPLTASGKLDRRALPDPVACDPALPYSAPRSELEVQLCDAVARVLQKEKVGIHDDFFEIGGDSLNAVLLMIDLRQTLDCDLALGEIIDYPTPASLAEHIASNQPIEEADDELPPLFMIPGVGGASPQLHRLLRGTKNRLRVVMLSLPDWSVLTDPGYDIGSLARSLVPQVAAAAGDRPVILGGYSLGGVIAYSLAKALVAEGHRVALLAILDTDIRRSFVDRDKGDEPADRHRELRLFYWRLARAMSLNSHGNRSQVFALAFARPLSKSWGRPFLRALKAFRPIPLKGRFRYFLRYRLLHELYAGVAERWRASRGAAPAPLTVPAILFVSAGQGGMGSSDLGWREHIPQLHIVTVEGDHFTMFDEPHLGDLCARLSDAVEAAAGTVPEHVWRGSARDLGVDQHDHPLIRREINGIRFRDE